MAGDSMARQVTGNGMAWQAQDVPDVVQQVKAMQDVAWQAHRPLSRAEQVHSVGSRLLTRAEQVQMARRPLAKTKLAGVVQGSQKAQVMGVSQVQAERDPLVWSQKPMAAAWSLQHAAWSPKEARQTRLSPQPTEAGTVAWLSSQQT